MTADEHGTVSPVTLGDIERAREERDRAERRYRDLIVRGLDQTAPKLDGTKIAKAAGVSRARIYQIRDEENIKITHLPDGRPLLRILLIFGDEAHVVTPEHTYKEPLRMPAKVIAREAGLPVNELPGRKFTATRAEDGTYSRFELLHDPRQ
jgi:hypothetical protein